MDNVIGLTVAGPLPQTPGQESPPGHRLAVPINIAKEFLKQAGINPDPGPLTKLWEEGLRLYSNGQYSEACDKFDSVYEKTGQIGTSIFEIGNPYVREMADRCKKKLKSTP